MTSTAEDIVLSFIKSAQQADSSETPYKHWFLKECLPADISKEIINLPFPAPDLGGVSGKRELHNATRKYFDLENQKLYSSVDKVSQAFQSQKMTNFISDFFKTDLSGSYLRIEYAQDIDGFWLEPHTDLGVKLFTLLLYLSDGEGHEKLGTDIYNTDKQHVTRSPFSPNAAMIFVPSNITYHGFEARKINGVRKSLIINYVTNEWLAREQLSYPEKPIS